LRRVSAPKPFRAPSADEVDLSARRGRISRRWTDLAAGLSFAVERTSPGSRFRKIVAEQVSNDGTRKWMLRMDEVQGIETVYIPEPDRGHVVHLEPGGLRHGLFFLLDPRSRASIANLSVAEIVGQVWLAHRELGEARITNIVFMGMGEPLANYRNVVPAMRTFLDDLGYDLSRRRVTLSTSGLVPQIYKLAEECNVALAVVAACAER